MSKELLFDIDSFNSPKVVEGAQADALLIHNTLMARSKGVHVTEKVAFEIRRYRFDEIKASINSIETELRQHCEKYLPSIYLDKVQVLPKTESKLYVAVSIVDKDTEEHRDIIFNVENKGTTLLTTLLSEDF